LRNQSSVGEERLSVYHLGASRNIRLIGVARRHSSLVLNQYFDACLPQCLDMTRRQRDSAFTRERFARGSKFRGQKGLRTYCKVHSMTTVTGSSVIAVAPANIFSNVPVTLI
jgi:hypothetical protein